MSWPVARLGELLRIEHGFAFKGEHFSEHGALVVLTPGNFHEAGGFRARPGKDRSYTGAFPERYVLKHNDLIVAMTEQGEGLLGSAALIPEPDRYLHNQRLGLVREHAVRADRRFLYYLFNTPIVREQIRNSCSGAKVRHTSPERIYRVEAPVPEPREQRKIAAILSAYDDLIANNQRRIALLETMAEEIYREWFVRRRIRRENGARAAGWSDRRFDELCEFAKGRTPNDVLQSPTDGALPYLSADVLDGNDAAAWVVARRRDVLAAEGDVVMLMDGARSGAVFRATAGVVGSTAALVKTAPVFRNVVFEYLRAMHDVVVWNNTGSAIPHANKDFIHRMLLRVPEDEHVLRHFNELYDPISSVPTSVIGERAVCRHPAVRWVA